MLSGMPGAREQFAESFGAVRSVFANPSLRRIELAFAGSVVGSYASAVVICLYAFQAGGVTAVSLLIVAKQATAAAVAPFAASLTDRFRRGSHTTTSSATGSKLRHSQSAIVLSSSTTRRGFGTADTI